MKRSFTAALLATMLVAGTALFTTAHANATGQSGLAALRAATARYHDVANAIASGRSDLHLCVNHMGEHYADPHTFSDGVLDPLDPEALVYADGPDGNLRLVAVEWVSTTPGEVMGIPLHLNPALNVYVLHAWIWAPNPDGMFADMNPRIGDCP